MPSTKSILPANFKHKQIFYDPSGNRWKLSIILLSIIVAFSIIILSVGIPFGVNIANIQAQVSDSKILSNTSKIDNIPKSVAFFNTQTSKSFISLKENIKNIDTLVLPWLGVKKVDNKILVNHSTDPYVKTVREAVQKNNPQINQFVLLSDIDYNLPIYEERNIGDLFFKLINTPELQDAFFESLVDSLDKGQYKGVVLEMQQDTVSKKYEAYSQFIKRLYGVLLDKKLSLQTKSNVYDDLKIIEITKQFSSLVMLDTYQAGLFSKDPASELSKQIKIQPLQNSTDQLTKVINFFPELNYKIILPTQSVDLYLYNGMIGWHSQISFFEVGEIIEKFKPVIKYDSVLGLSTFEYTDTKNQLHKIIINDSIATYNQISKLKSLPKQPISIGFENIGYEEPSSWAIIQSKNTEEKKEILKNKLQFDTQINVTGQGVINKLKQNPEFGKREISFLDTKILDTKITKFPTKSLVNKTGYKKGYIALTFDDGPDPKYTPQILDILKDNNIKATFFTLGSKVLEYPELAQRIVKEGHLLGNHTFTHPRLKNAESITLINEIESTQKSIKEVTDITPLYFRTPYNDFGDYETNRELQPLRTLETLNIKISESDLDSFDYETQDLNQIINFVKNGYKEDISSQVLFHDSGGKYRESTVKALPEVIKFLKEKDLKFVTVEQLDKLSEDKIIDTLKPEVSNFSSISKTAFFQFSGKSEWLFKIILLVATVLGLLRLLILIIGLYKNFREKNNENYDLGYIENLPPVSVLIPCYNEEKVICNTIDSILNSDYTNLEVVVIDDRSTDNSLKIIKSKYSKNPKVTILSKLNNGKAEALNFGLKYAKFDFIVSMDADTMFLPNTLEKMMQPFTNPKIGGVAGFVEVGNDYFYQKSQGQKAKFNWLTTCQRLEYICGQNFDKLAYNGLGCVVVVPGAIGAWRKNVIVKAGGYKTDTLAEDTDLTVRVLRMGWEIKFCKEAFCITEAPETIQQFWKQRIRWQFGTLQVIVKNLDIIFNPKHKAVSMFAIPYMFFNFFSMLVSPLANIPLLILMIKIYAGAKVGFFMFSQSDQESLKWMLIFIIGYILIEYLITVFAIVQYRFKGKWVLLLFIPIQILFFRLLTLIITIRSILKAFEGKIVGWGHLQRTGNVQMKIKKFQENNM